MYGSGGSGGGGRAGPHTPPPPPRRNTHAVCLVLVLGLRELFSEFYPLFYSFIPRKLAHYFFKNNSYSHQVTDCSFYIITQFNSYNLINIHSLSLNGYIIIQAYKVTSCTHANYVTQPFHHTEAWVTLSRNPAKQGLNCLAPKLHVHKESACIPHLETLSHVGLELQA